MEPKIIETGQMTLVGFSFFGDPFETNADWMEENEIGRLWARFMRYLTNYGSRIKHIKNNETAYEVHIEHEETVSKGFYEIFVGVEVEKPEDVPVELLIKALPSTQYAVFTLHGEEIISDWSKIIQEWMLDSGYQRAHKFGFQLYDQRFKGLENIAESVIDVFTPVK